MPATATPETVSTPAAPRDTPDLVRCVGLTKVFKDFWLRPRVTAVDAIDLDIRQGEVFGLLGPNGSGKSTTIKMLLGLLTPTAGKIAVFGKHPSDVGTKKRIGYLPEESYLYRFLSARETLDYYGKLFGLAPSIRRQRIDMLLEMVGLEHAARRPVGEFSKGMTRKVGLAQALINDPDLLILDEPTSGMDPIATADVKRVILQLKERGKTVLLCSHLLADVEDVTDRVAVMFGGKVRSRGRVDELLTQTDRTTFTTGAMNEQEQLAVMSALERIGVLDATVSRPRQSLEALFLDIVRQAQAEGAVTAGARSGGAIAGFLSQGGMAAGELPQEVAPEQVLAALQRVETDTALPGDSTQANASHTSDASAAPASPPAPEHDVLAELVGGNQAGPAEPAEPAPAPAQVSVDADRGVLDALLGGPAEDGSAPPTDRPV